MRAEDLKRIRDAADTATAVRKNLYLSPAIPFSFQHINNFVYTAVRGIGKSVISVETVIILKRKYGYENVKAFYFRLTDLSIKAMLANHAAKAIDPYLVAKYDLQITCKGNIVYDHGKPLIEFYPLVSAGSKGKGVNLYDCNYFNKRPINPRTGKPIKRYIVTIWDEFLMAEGVEKKSVGDPVAQYRIYMEAITRDQERLDYQAVINYLLANSVSECAAVTGALFNYIPKPANHKIVKLTRKHTIFWNCPVTQAYLDKRSKSYNADIMDYENDPNYTNVVERDLALIKPKRTRLRRVTNVIKFSKATEDWFCVYDGRYIRKWKGEGFKKSIVVPMRRYLDELYDAENMSAVIARYDARAYMYADLMSQALFTSKLKQLKSR